MAVESAAAVTVFYTKPVKSGIVAVTKVPIQISGYITGGYGGDGKTIPTEIEQGWQCFQHKSGGCIFIKEDCLAYGDSDYIEAESIEEYIVHEYERLFDKKAVRGVDYYIDDCGEVPVDVSPVSFNSVEEMIEAVKNADLTF